jgi:F0F1-type ATP synthase assembly protein I
MKPPREPARSYNPSREGITVKKEEGPLTSLGVALSLTMLLPAAAFVGYALGWGFDRLFSTTFLRYVFLVLGIAAGIVQSIRELKKSSGE